MSGNSSLFGAVIEDHLALKRRNSHLDERLPLDEFLGDDPFDNHPLFKSEEDARREEEETGEQPVIVRAPRTADVPADTDTMPRVAADDQAAASWMETQTAPEFRWD